MTDSTHLADRDDDRPVVLITGSRKGIGRGLAEHFCRQGAVVEGCSREASDFEHPAYSHHLVDVTDEEQVKAMIADVDHRHRRLDVLVNNAGVAGMNHFLLTPASALDRIFAVNVRGAFVASREAARIMRRRRYGRIVNVGSVAVPLELEGEAAYVAAKSAILGLTRVLARELAPFGITVNLVGPAPIDTDLIRNVPPEKIQALLDRLAIKRLGTCEDVANVVDFLASQASGAVTGQAIYLGGA